MKEISIDTGINQSRVLIGESIDNLSKYLPNKKTVIISDTNLIRLYGDRFPDFPVIDMGLTETNKTMQTLENIFAKFLEFEVDRSWFVLAIGGGIVCDVAGFAASVFMRGLSFGFVSTSLLSQVDASVGGKNGVNFTGYKNMIGVFNQPDFVICDTEMLKTLPDNEFKAGFSEIIKAGAIKSKPLFEYLEQNADMALQHNPEVIEHMVYESVKIKADVVEADEREKGERKKLNFGHTIAHSLEKLTGMLHGEAVSIGMVLASKISVKKGLLTEAEAEKVKALVEKFGLPTENKQDLEQVYTEMKRDKKRDGNKIHFILLNTIGDAIIEPIELNTLEEIINDLR